jgi:hypothetical protein
MTTCSVMVRGILCGAALGAVLAIAPAASAQSQGPMPVQDIAPINTTSTTVGAPIVVKEDPVKPVWLRAEVVHADSHTIIVRDEDNAMLIHTFTYSEKAQNKMNQILDNGGYQSGDKVRIRWVPGGSEALDIKGRPSKPI